MIDFLHTPPRGSEDVKWAAGAGTILEGGVGMSGLHTPEDSRQRIITIGEVVGLMAVNAFSNNTSELLSSVSAQLTNDRVWKEHVGNGAIMEELFRDQVLLAGYLIKPVEE